MRVSSLSNAKIIDLISRHFVPVWISRDRYQLDAVDRAETDLIRKIDTSRREKKLEGGAVCVYITRASGEVFATMIVQKASKPENLEPFLNKIITNEKLSVRKAADAAASKAPPPTTPCCKTEDGRLFVARGRFDDRVNRGVGRDVVELTRAEWKDLVPKQTTVGHTFAVPKATAEKLLRHVYPPLPHWSESKVKITTCTLEASVAETTGGVAKLRLTGKVEMIYPFLGKADDGTVTSGVTGVATVKDGKLTGLTLVSEKGRYIRKWQGKSLPSDISFAVEMQP